MSFWKKLLGGHGGEGSVAGAPKVLGEEEYNGYVIRAIEVKAGSEYQLCGEIEKEIDGEVKVAQFIRADKISDRGQVAEISLAKGRQVVDEQGEKVFDGGGW